MLSNMKIRTKTILGFIIILILTIFISVFAILNINTIAKNVRSLFDERYMRAEAISSIRRRIPSARASLFEAIVAKEPTAQQNAIKDAATHADRVGVLMGEWKAFLVSANDTAMLEKFSVVEKDLVSFNSARDKIQKAILSNDLDGASTMIINEFVPVVNLIEANLMDIIDQETVFAGNFVTDSEKLQRGTLFLLIGILCAVVLLIIAITYIITTSINKPIKEIVSATQKMAKGDLGISISYKSENEFGMLSDSVMATIRTMQTYIENIALILGKMAKGDLTVSVDMDYIGDFTQIKASMVEITDSLNDILLQINQASNQVLSGAGQVSNAAQSLSQGTTEQASSIEELSASIEDISNQIKKNAENAQSAKTISLNSTKIIENANVQMVEMVAAMERINETSKKISKIIKTIDEIAFQTNILALNAAVEAARAGEAGKGFAVVADEVRNLASKSAEAAKDTTLLIENSIQAVNKGTKIADETAKSLIVIVEDSKRSADLINLISEASSMQAQAISQTTLGVGQISGVVQTNSATAQESAAASEELSGQADMLNQLVGKFMLRKAQDSYDPELRFEMPQHPAMDFKMPKGSSKY